MDLPSFANSIGLGGLIAALTSYLGFLALNARLKYIEALQERHNQQLKPGQTCRCCKQVYHPDLPPLTPPPAG